MDGRDELLTLAEIAVGLAGFAGVVVAVFVQREGLHHVDRLRFVGVFGLAFVTVVLAFWPVALIHLGFEAPGLWRIASGGMIVAWTVIVAPTLPFMARVRTDVAVDSLLPVAFMWIPAVGNLLVQILNAAGWFWEPGFVGYLVGLLVYLYSAGLLFVYSVLFRPREGGVAEDPK